MAVWEPWIYSKLFYRQAIIYTYIYMYIYQLPEFSQMHKGTEGNEEENIFKLQWELYLFIYFLFRNPCVVNNGIVFLSELSKINFIFILVCPHAYLLPCCLWMSLNDWWHVAFPPEKWHSHRVGNHRRDQKKSLGLGCCLSASCWVQGG
jgi:hypothetical protein